MKCPHCDGTGELSAPHFGDLLLAARRAKKMTQEELASLSGVSRAQLANMETGRTDTSFRTLSRIAIALGCSMKDLVP